MLKSVFGNLSYLLYLLGFLCLRKVFLNHRVVLPIVLTLSVAYSLWLCNQYIYQYSADSYKQMAQELKKRNIQQVAQIAGNGLTYYEREGGFLVVPVLRQVGLNKVKEEGAQWVVLDRYFEAINLRAFDSLSSAKSYVHLPAPALLSPLFYLEHAEYTGLGFSQTMQLREKAKQAPAQLQLIRMGE